jgi:hypothetical protein
MSTTRKPEFTPGVSIDKATAERTSTLRGALDAIAMYNNCNLVELKDHWVLIHATPFACSGIARQLGFKVYRALPKHGPDHWVVDTRRPATVEVV